MNQRSWFQVTIFLLLMALVSIPYVQATPTPYPTGIAQQSCATDSGYIYCVGGYATSNMGNPTNAVYSASVSSGGVGSWSSQPNYLTNIVYQSCATDSGYIYCVGGQTTSSETTSTDAVYSASLSSGVVGTWTSTTAYPISVGSLSCAIDSGYIYCVGGTAGFPGTNAVYSASVSGGSVGTWSSQTNYPTSIVGQSCAIDSGYIYCVAGNTGSYTNAVYSASVSDGSVGTWSSTTPYAMSLPGPSCAIDSGYIYCVGGSETDTAYEASESGGVVGTWIGVAQYANIIVGQSCAADSGYMYCVGGFSNGSPSPAVFSTAIVLPTTSTTTSTITTIIVSTVTLPPVTLTVSYSLVGGGLTVYNPTAPDFHYVLGGVSKSLKLSKTAQGVVVDGGSSWFVTPNPLGGSTSSQRWYSNQALSGSAVSSTAMVFSFYRQTLETLSYSVNGGGSGYSPPTFQANQFGSTTSVALTGTATGYWFDYTSAWTISNPLTGSSSYERWFTTHAITGTILGSSILAFTYQHQFYLTMLVNPSATGLVTPGSGWFSAGATVTITAAPVHTKFLSWTGVGTGSYTGTKNPTTVTMNSAITETANFS